MPPAIRGRGRRGATSISEYGGSELALLAAAVLRRAQNSSPGGEALTVPRQLRLNNDDVCPPALTTSSTIKMNRPVAWRPVAVFRGRGDLDAEVLTRCRTT